MARVEIDPDWLGNVEVAWGDFADERLGPDIADDARRYAPKRTAALAASVEHHLEGTELVISASDGGEDGYATAGPCSAALSMPRPTYSDTGWQPRSSPLGPNGPS